MDAWQSQAWLHFERVHGRVSASLRYISKRPVCLPEGNDILTKEESETIQFATYLQILPCVECSITDAPRVTGVLRNFAARGKLNIICAGSDFMTL
jgi:hypothetical protein